MKPTREEPIRLEALYGVGDNGLALYAKGHFATQEFALAIVDSEWWEDFGGNVPDPAKIHRGYMRWVPVGKNSIFYGECDYVAQYPAKPGRGAFKATWIGQVRE